MAAKKAEAAAATGKKGNAAALKKAQEAGESKRAEARAKKITVLVKENPKREGSEGHKRFSLYKKGMTVGEYIEAGGKMVDIHYDEAHEFISVS